MTHPTSQELLELTQRGADPELSARLRAHIAVCERCAALQSAMGRVEGALNSLRAESPSRAFERNVLRVLGLKEAGSLWWTFLKNFAPILVAGIVMLSIVSYGSNASGSAGRFTGNPVVDGEKIRGVVSDALGGFSTGVGDVVRKYVSLLFSGGSVPLTLYLVFLFAGIGLLDKYLIGPIFRRRHQGWRL